MAVQYYSDHSPFYTKKLDSTGTYGLGYPQYTHYDRVYPPGFKPPKGKEKTWEYDKTCGCKFCKDYEKATQALYDVKFNTWPQEKHIQYVGGPIKPMVEKKAGGMTAKEAVVIRLERAIKLVKEEDLEGALKEISTASTAAASFRSLVAQAEKMQNHVDAVMEAVEKDKAGNQKMPEVKDKQF